jgi:hypothetical protein
MTKLLRNAIEALISSLKSDRFAIPIKELEDLEKAYKDNRAVMTETSKRIEFLQDCLETGVSKREAARMLMAHDPRIGQRTAETLVYINFSGQYQTTMRGRRRSKPVAKTAPVRAPLPDIEDDEAIL